ncbi:MAG: FAD/NAD(P)-binding protein, partial [Streptomycetaceae bacterium]|nr:FAD/NAD(P)-binding protein [Streptomycetaceae bacterium]
MPAPPVSIAVVGCGPGGTSLVERLCANAAVLLKGRRLHLHVIDPYPPGAGRIWRSEQSPLLWANSLASHITVFTDASSTCEGPIRPGPSVWEWGRDRAAELRAGRLAADLLPYADELARITPFWFPSRPLLSAYLEWAFRHTVATAPPNVRVAVYRDHAVDITDAPEKAPAAPPGAPPRQHIELAGGARITVDAVVLSQGHGDTDPTPDERRLAAHAARDRLVYLPRGYTADLDLDALRPGEPVLARGIGLAFIDLMVRVTAERGGRFVRDADGTLAYRPSGREPVLLAASRRGVPYRAKIGYELTGDATPVPHFLTVDAFADRPGPGALEFDRDIRPLLDREMTWAYYHRLCTAHPERTALTWDTFATRYTALTDPARSAHRDRHPAAEPPETAGEIAALIARAVPDPACVL